MATIYNITVQASNGGVAVGAVFDSNFGSNSFAVHGGNCCDNGQQNVSYPSTLPPGGESNPVNENSPVCQPIVFPSDTELNAGPGGYSNAGNYDPPRNETLVFASDTQCNAGPGGYSNPENCDPSNNETLVFSS